MIIPYIFYRITKFLCRDYGNLYAIFINDYESFAPTLGAMNTLGLFGMNLLTIANLISTDSIVFGIQHNYIGTGFVLIGALISSKKYYLKLCEKYKEEQHGSIKGWCVFTYICAPIVAYCCSFND